MSTKDMIIGGLWTVALVLLLLVGVGVLGQVEEGKYVPGAFAVGLFVGGMILDRLWSQP